jgi:signal transduction histidine kinase
MAEADLTKLKREKDNLQAQVTRLSALNKIALKLGTTLDFESFLEELINSITQFVPCERVLLLLPDDQQTALEFGIANFQLMPEEKQADLEHLRLPTYQPDEESIVYAWQNQQTVLVKPVDISKHPSFERLSNTINSTNFISAPLFAQGGLVGVVIADNGTTGSPMVKNQQDALDMMSESVGVALQNARLHAKTVLDLAGNMREMHILRQIDRELNDTIDLNHVFEMTLDWTLRFTNAQSASLAMYDQETDQLHFLVEYGYDVPSEKLQALRKEYGAGIAHRVARSGHPEVVPDTTMDKDFVRLSASTRSQISVPVLREDRVVAVITLESRRLNGFNDNHLDFVEKLATRAGVAIDNARLYAEAVREREKLSHILNNTADIVIVVGTDDRIILINQSALAALRLNPNENYVGRMALQVFEGTQLFDVFQRAKQAGENITRETVSPSERIFHTNLRFFPEIGCIIVMHDITPFKEMDKLKSELVATVSHDLKQPLSVMNGYIELMTMQQAITPQGMNSANMIRRAVLNMRQLIDDLLDLTKIESGIKLDLQPVQLSSIIADCLDQVRPSAQSKAMTVTNEVSNSHPMVIADRARLRQILINLIGNAVKYTPPEGWVKIYDEQRGDNIRLAIQDSGFGISPEDQMHIFDRFYRVRRPETDNIEGTGLGLAIVKSLVEAHSGKIVVESKLGEGSTFYLTLPMAVEEVNHL